MLLQLFPERIKTRIFGRTTRFAFHQAPSVEAFKCSSNSQHGEQFTISHPVVQPQSLRFNDSPDIIRSNECTQKDSCYKLGQGLNPKHAVDQGLNLSSNQASGSSHRAQNTQFIVETSNDIPVRLDDPEESQCKFAHAALCNNTAVADLGMNPAANLCSSAANKVVGSSLVVPGAVNAMTHESVDSASDFIPIYDINHAGVEEKFAKFAKLISVKVTLI